MGPLAVPEGGFAYLPGSTNPFSNGVVALAGHALTRVRLRKALPLAQGLEFAAAYLARRNRPSAAFAACELRSPAPMTREDFRAFGATYTSQLRANGFGAESAFPVGRSNMAPLFDPPIANMLFAFTFAAPTESAGGSDFVISGKPENTENPPGITASGDTSPQGMKAKAGFVIDALRQRVTALGCRWSDITGAQAYTVYSLDPVMEELRAASLTSTGLTLFPAYPPVIGLDFEIDVRSVGNELAV